MLIADKHSGYVRGTRLLFKKDEAAPDPRLGEASIRQIQLAEQQWESYNAEGGDRDWLKGITEEALDIQRGTAEASRNLSDYQLEQMRFNDERYRNNTIPYQDALDSEIDKLYNEENISRRAASAGADTGAAMDASTEQMRRGLTRRGVNVNSGNMTALENATSLMRGTAVASASNKTRQAMEQAGLATRFQSLGAKLGLSGLGATNAGLAMSGMGTGLNAAGGMSGSAAGSIGVNNSTFGSTMSGMSAGIGNGLSYNQAQNNSSGDGGAGALQAVGSIAGAAAMFFSDVRMKKNIKPIKRDTRGFWWYEFEYLGSNQRHVGVMAHEVEPIMPEAVSTIGGFKAVNYAML